jgi:hypothetical protein
MKAKDNPTAWSLSSPKAQVAFLVIKEHEKSRTHTVLGYGQRYTPLAPGEITPSDINRLKRV